MPRKNAAFVCILLIIILSAVGCTPSPPQSGGRYLVGAYFYTWYPVNFMRGGHLRQFLSPPQQPALGHYAANDRKVLEQQISWCSRYGVDFLAVDYWPRRPSQNQAFLDNLLAAKNLADVKFCLFFETHNLGFDRGEGWVEFTPAAKKALAQSVAQAAKRYFGHPQYLRIQGRPVLILYLSRNFFGDVAGALKELRQAVEQQGHQVYLIGDEVFWKLTGWNGQPGRPPATEKPVMERIKLFDAITAYNMYENGHKSQAGYPGESRFVPEVAAKYAQFKKAAQPKTSFVPNLIPGYNDRGVRLSRDHYAIPRQWMPGEPEGSFFGKAFDLLAKPFLDPSHNMILITSFNEWNEDTAIEPLKPSPPTARDVSDNGRKYTQGYQYAGFGAAYLQVLRDKVAAISGRVLGPGGGPARGARVCAWREGRELACSRSDYNGWYRLPRPAVSPGPALVGLAGGGPRRQVMVTPEKTATGVGLTAPPQNK